MLDKPINIVLFEPEEITCRRCGQVALPHYSDKHLCAECVRVENQRYNYFHSANPNWLAVAEMAGVELWERQPEENDREWAVWCAYRDMYPSRKPSYRGAAETLGTTYEVVRKIAKRWHFETRMQAWVKYTDQLTIRQRQQEIVDMNKTHVSMALKLNAKLNTAIDELDPNTLKPNELVNLLKLSTELERKAKLDPTIVNAPVMDDDNPMLKKSTTPMNDLAEVVAILQHTGALQSAMGVGVKKTETTVTEVVVMND